LVLYLRQCCSFGISAVVFPSSDGAMATFKSPPSPLHFIATSWLSLLDTMEIKWDEIYFSCSVIDMGISTVTIGFCPVMQVLVLQLLALMLCRFGQGIGLGGEWGGAVLLAVHRK
jgi:MFS family permease